MSIPSPPPGPLALTVPPQAARPAPPGRLDPACSPLVAGLLRTGDRAAFLAAVRATGTPLVDDLGDGTCAVTFVVPDAPGLTDVLVLPNKIADPAHPDASRAERLPGAWVLTHRMPRDWRASYAIAAGGTPDPAQAATVEQRRARALAAAPDADHDALHRFFDGLARARPDPLAREHLPDGTSVVSLPGAPPLPPLDGPAGRVGTVLDGRLPDGRAVWLHEPAGTDPAAPLPVAVVLDGERWAGVGLPAALDGLLARGDLPPVRTVGVASGPLAQRSRELACDPSFVAFLRDDVLGWAGEQRALSAEPGRTAVVGQSLGGLTALYATQVAPERFGLALSQSGSFWWPNPAGGAAAEWLTSVVPAGPRTHGVHLEVGTEEWVLREPTRRLRSALRARGDRVRYREFRGGHDLACWRAGLADALAGLLREAL
ncbi:alpha/beta hydrolase-fold protein [Pseudonocardia halophobica]|uniref:Enterochelin esterase n=1 Tax=Pseudonocardia halophobica TaxID=29401 RepID=A0A9W6L292_9PSEU|nr:alpha/beta hydrolase-fold protein [Pseudonocardia halophobica]GLL10851.1 enterochelin esterase [Pseudonocardia halophobica]